MSCIPGLHTVPYSKTSCKYLNLSLSTRLSSATMHAARYRILPSTLLRLFSSRNTACIQQHHAPNVTKPTNDGSVLPTFCSASNPSYYLLMPGNPIWILREPKNPQDRIEFSYWGNL